MKNKEWLKEEIESDGVQLEYLYANYYTDDKAIMIDDVRHLIDQLDEPEITEEMAWEVIERANHYHIAPADVWIYKEAIQKGVLPNDFTGLEENPTISKKETVEVPLNFIEKRAKMLLSKLHDEMAANGIEPIGQVESWRKGLAQNGKKGDKLGLYAIDDNGDMYFWTGISRGDEWIKIETLEVKA